MGRRPRLTVEQRLGGRVYETWDDGATVDWGADEVELAFTALGPGLTRVSVEHRGWEDLTAEQLGEDCAEPGGYMAGTYSRGWHLVLERFAASLEEAS